MTGPASDPNRKVSPNAGVREAQTVATQPTSKIRSEPDYQKLVTLRELITMNPEVGDAALMVNGTLTKQRLREFNEIVSGVKAVYDMARLDDPKIVKFISELGCPLSAASGHHLYLANDVGIPSSSVRHGFPVLTEDTVEAAKVTKPPVIAVDDVDGIDRLISKGVLGQPGYSPRVAIHVKTGGQPYVNPRQVQDIVDAAKACGVNEFEIVGTVSADHHDTERISKSLAAVKEALAQLTTLKDARVVGVHIAGGLQDARTLEKAQVDPEQFLRKIAQAVEGFKRDAAQLGYHGDVSMDIGRWLIGESCLVAKTTGTRTDKGQFQVFTVESRYNGLNGTMHDAKRIDVGMVPRLNGSDQSLVESQILTVVQGGSCDSIDKLPDLYSLSAQIQPGDWLTFFSTGADSISCGLDFNMIESAGVVLYTTGDGKLESSQSPLLRKQKFILEAIRAWNRDGRVTEALEEYLRNVDESDIKFREGDTLLKYHLRALTYLRNHFSASPHLEENRLVSTGFLMQDGLQVVATIEALLDGLGVDGLCIAQKAQNDPTVVALEYAVNAYLERKGKGSKDGRRRVMMDTASEGEMLLAEACGFPPSEMIVSHPHKTDATIARMKEFRPWASTFDSEQELDRVIKGGAGPMPATETAPAYDPTALVRIKASAIGVKNDLSSKFGVDIDEAVRLLVTARDKGFTKFGVAFHVGTQCCKASNYGNTLQGILEVMRKAKEYGIEISTVDIGGGFPDTRATQAASLPGKQAILQRALWKEIQQLWSDEGVHHADFMERVTHTLLQFDDVVALKNAQDSKSEESRTSLLSEIEKLLEGSRQIVLDTARRDALQAERIQHDESMGPRRLPHFFALSLREKLRAIRNVVARVWSSSKVSEPTDIRGVLEADTRLEQQKSLHRRVCSSIAQHYALSQGQLIKDIGAHINSFRSSAREQFGQEVYIVAEPGRIITDRGTILTPIVRAYGGSVHSTVASVRLAEFLRGGLSGQTHDEQSWDMRIISGPHREKEFAFYDKYGEPRDGVALVTSAVYGATGFESDRFKYRGEDYELPVGIQRGDLMAIYCTGSYSSSAGAIAQGMEPSGVVLAFRDLFKISPVFSKNKIFRAAVREYYQQGEPTGPDNEGMQEAA